jgi:hypothetical protein
MVEEEMTTGKIQKRKGNTITMKEMSAVVSIRKNLKEP